MELQKTVDVDAEIRDIELAVFDECIDIVIYFEDGGLISRELQDYKTELLEKKGIIPEDIRGESEK